MEKELLLCPQTWKSPAGFTILLSPFVLGLCFPDYPLCSPWVWLQPQLLQGPELEEPYLNICLLLKSQETLKQLEPDRRQTVLITSRDHICSMSYVCLVCFVHLFVFHSFQGTREVKRIRDLGGQSGGGVYSPGLIRKIK